MDASGPQPADARTRRSELVAAAYRRLAASGFEGLRTRDVAGDAGVNVATLHYYFPTKEALIRAVMTHAVSRFATTLGSAGSREEQLRSHLRGLRRLLREEPELSAVMGELAMRSVRDPAIAEMLQGSDAAWHGWLVRLLGGDESAPARASLIQAVLRGLLMFPATAQDSERVDQALLELERLLGDGPEAPAAP